MQHMRSKNTHPNERDRGLSDTRFVENGVGRISKYLRKRLFGYFKGTGFGEAML